MTEVQRPAFAPEIVPSVEALIARHGARAVLLAALRALVKPQQWRPPPTEAADLTAHLRRDVGLPPAPPGRPVLPPLHPPV